MTGDSQAERMT